MQVKWPFSIYRSHWAINFVSSNCEICLILLHRITFGFPALNSPSSRTSSVEPRLNLFACQIHSIAVNSAVCACRLHPLCQNLSVVEKKPLLLLNLWKIAVRLISMFMITSNSDPSAFAFSSLPFGHPLTTPNLPVHTIWLLKSRPESHCCYPCQNIPRRPSPIPHFFSRKLLSDGPIMDQIHEFLGPGPYVTANEQHF